jgi:ATP-binding cassette, subfamily B, multidrug efflux pump
LVPTAHSVETMPEAKSKRASYLRLLREVLLSRPWTRVAILIASLLSTFWGLLSPLFQKEFVDLLTEQGSQLDHKFAWMNYFIWGNTPLSLIGFSFISLFLSLGFAQLANYLGARESILMQRRLAQRLYDKALTLRADSLRGRPVGEIVAVYATDIPGSTIFLEQSVPTGASILFPLVSAPPVIAYLFDIPVGPTLILMVSVGILNFFMAYRQSVYFFNFKKMAADRIGLVNEWIQNIRTLRILGWVRNFEAKIFATREVETANRIAMVTNGQAMNSIASSITYVLNIVVISTFVFLTAQHVSSGALFALLWIVGIFLTKPFRQMPWLFTFIFDSWTSLTRVSDFLQLENLEDHQRNEEFQKIQELTLDSPAISVRNLNLRIGDNEVLKSIDLDIRKGEFVAIVGEVGAGKSLLLLSLMGETGAKFAEYRLGGNDATTLALHQLRQFFTFVPQEGFIMSSSLRDNVAFDYDISKAQDQNILRSLSHAQFNLDVERVEAGLDTEIGERGVNLSGGQKQRVSLARVDFYKTPLILMDDCLSALDVETEELLIDSLLKGAWKDQTRLLVTHRLTVLDQVDRVIFLERGKIIAQGAFADLLKSNAKFRDFTATVAKESFSEAPREPEPPLTQTLAESKTVKHDERFD